VKTISIHQTFKIFKGFLGCVTLKALTSVLQKIQVFWDVTACELHQGLLDPQNEGTLIIQDVGNHLTNNIL